MYNAFKMSGHVKCFDEAKYKSFSIKDKQLLEAHNKTWDKISNAMKNEFDSEPVSNKNILKLKNKIL